jgi:hypothetical protein
MVEKGKEERALPARVFRARSFFTKELLRHTCYSCSSYWCGAGSQLRRSRSETALCAYSLHTGYACLSY